jgi:type I restriction enzyme M protein
MGYDMQEGSVLVEKVLPYLREIGFGAIIPEQSFGVGSRRVRADAVAYGESDKPVVIVEIKSKLDTPPFDNYHPAVQQAYKIALVAETPYFLVTDGEQFLWFWVDWENGRADQSDPPIQTPVARQRLRPFRNEAEAAQVLWAIVEQSRGKIAQSEYLTYLVVALRAKLYDELRIRSGKSGQFYARPGENHGAVSQRIKELLAEQSSEWTSVPDETLTTAVELLQPFSLLETPSQILTDVLNGLIQRSFRLEAGEFLTPSPITEFVIKLLLPQPAERIIDPTCGTGGLLLAVLNYWQESSEKSTLPTENLIGVDINSQVAQIAELKLMLTIAGNANIYVADSLDQSALDRFEIRRDTFDVVVSNPPIGIRVQEAQARQFQLGRFPARSEALFIEQSLALLKDGGRMAIIIPDGILFQASSEQVRRWVMKTARIDAIIQLPGRAGIPQSAINTSILVLTKGVASRDSVFMARLTELGSPEHGPAIETSDLRVIASDFRRFLWGERDFKKGWTVANTPALVERMDVGGNDPLFQVLREQFGALSYEIQTLDQIAEVGKGHDLLAAEVGEIPIITARDISTGLIKIERPRYVAASAVRISLLPGDLLVSEFGSRSPPALIKDTDLPATIGRSVFLIRLIKDTLSSEFLRFLFTTDLIGQQLELLKSGTIARITLQDMRRLLIPIPDKKTQNDILKTLAEIRALRERAAELEVALAAKLM